MKLITGLAEVRKIAAASGDIQSVTVTDSDGFVRLALSATAFPAALTPEEARKIAKDLVASAKRVAGERPA